MNENHIKMELKYYPDNDIMWEFQLRLTETYKREGLMSIQGIEGHGNSFEISGENVLASYMDAVGKGQDIYRPKEKTETKRFDHFKVFNDLKLISDEILHFTGLTCLYSKYLTNPLSRPVLFNGKTVYVNHQSMEDKRFFMYASCAIEKLYNYWDRIGDLLASYFPEKIKPEKVFFSGLERFVPKELRGGEDFKWLVAFKKGKFSQLNRTRIKIVHYESLDTEFSDSHRKTFNDRDQLIKLIEKRSEIIPNLKEHIQMTLKGLQRTIRFMEYLNEEVLTDEVIKEKRLFVHGEEKE